MTAILWFRRDLRVSDNPALEAAVATGRPVLPVYILDDDDAGDWRPGGASRWWLHGSLAALGSALERHSNELVLRRGSAATVLAALVEETDASHVFWNRRYEPWAKARDEEIKSMLKASGVDAQSFNGSLLREPWEVQTKAGAPYKVFTPYWRALRALGEPPAPSPAPEDILAPAQRPESDGLDSWELRPTTPDWAAGLRETWQPGEDSAQTRIAAFAEDIVFSYREARDLPGVAGTSRLSPHLHFGEISPRQIWQSVVSSALTHFRDPMPKGVETYLSEIAWREFSYHLLFHFPKLPHEPLRPQFAGFDWEDDPEGLGRWQRGETGYPIVDAGMRELWTTGWMHNRVRMIVASFLIKDLLIHWREGAAWFWDTLVDADLASNSASWQWVAGSGTDAAPYFRVFNPTLQGAKFDPEGDYVRRWVPEIASLPNKLIHAPWTASPLELADAGLTLGADYPMPVVDHGFARTRALERLKRLKEKQDG